MPEEKRKTVCVDLDGVIAHYEGWKGVKHIGDPLPGAREFLQRLIQNYDVVIHTTRTNPDINHQELQDYSRENKLGLTPLQCARRIVALWLHKNEMPYSSIWTGNGKPIAMTYINDRALGCTTNEPGYPVIERLLQARFLSINTGE